MNLLYPLYKQALLGAGVNLLTGTVKAVLVDLDAYAYSAAHQFLSSVPAGSRVGAPQTLANKTVVNGAFDADDISFPAVTGAVSEAILLYVDTGTESTSALVALIDGRVRFDVSGAAASGATSLPVEDLPAGIASGATLTKISGTGPTTITTSAAAATGDRSVTVAALSSAVVAGAVYEYSAAGAGLPVSPNGGAINVTWPAAGIFAL